jgi:hypothetical protein
VLSPSGPFLVLWATKRWTQLTGYLVNDVIGASISISLSISVYLSIYLSLYLYVCCILFDDEDD